MLAVGSLLSGMWRSLRLIVGGFLVALASVGLLVGVTWAADGFGDDSGSVHEPAIDALAAEGILEGTECGQGLICPDDPFERWTMAVWLVRALGEAPSESEVRFADVDPVLWWAMYAERLAELGITSGCATEPARYCPDDPATRGQMATFLVRALDLNPAGAVGFADTGDDTHAANIDALAAAGVTAGCATEPARYCPDDPVTRGQMATFLARALGLVPLPELPVQKRGEELGAPFEAVATGTLVTCALRMDGTVDCWAAFTDGWEAETPDGRFSAVVVDPRPCGLRTDGTVDCWGLEPLSLDAFELTYAWSDAPDRKFVSITGGPTHLCGILDDGSVACWGSDKFGQTQVPEGGFSAVSNGYHHSCGIRIDGTVACWGRNDEKQSDPPEGLFVTVAAGPGYSCGIRIDGTVACWGALEPGPPEDRLTTIVSSVSAPCGIRTDGAIVCWGRTGESIPEGEFSAVDLGPFGSCGLRTDGEVACWGYAGIPVGDPPPGPFISISTTGFRTCGIRPGGTIECWGEGLWLPWTPEATYPPHGDFVDVDTGGRRYTCGLGTDGTVQCWGAIHGEGLEPPRGRFTAIATGQAPTGWPFSYFDYPTSCGIRAEDRALDCWGSHLAGSPPGEFTAISAGLTLFCGIRVDGTVACWTRNRLPSLEPEGRFTAVAVGDTMSCGILVGGAVECWPYGTGSDSTEGPPEGRFVDVSSFDAGEPPFGDDRYSAGTGFCGVRTDGSVTCWGANLIALANPPEGPFVEVATGDAHACALRRGGTVACWGSDEWGQSSPPEGHFVAVTAGDSNTCGVRTDGRAVCWGEDLALPLPVGVKELGARTTTGDPPTSTTTRHIAYTSEGPDGPSVIVMDRDGSDKRVIAWNGSDPSWSPDGSRIAFTTFGNLHTVDVFGARRQQVTRNGGSAPAWSPDGSLIAYLRDGQLFTVDIDGTGERRITDGARITGSPIWSPDGEFLAYSTGHDLIVIAADGTSSRWLAHGSDPSWSPDGSRIAFSGTIDGMSEVFVIAVDGTGARQLTHGGGQDPAWSPAGAHIAYTGWGSTTSGPGEFVALVNAQGDPSPKVITGDGGRGPVWSPDGTLIVYTVERQGTGARLNWVDPTTTGYSRLVGSPAYDVAWSPQSR